MHSWLESYWLMLKWQALSRRVMLPLLVAIQVMIAIGFVIGLGFLFPDVDPQTAKMLTTGAPTLILLTTGLVAAPQMIAMARKEGTYDYIWSLPIPRMVFVAADVTIWVLVALPGAVLAIVLGALYHDFQVQVSPLVIPALLLVGATGTLLGYAVGHGAPKPEMAQVATQILVFALMLFSPVLYPPSQLPGWLADIHSFMPVGYMAELSRGTLTDLPVDLGRSFLIVATWCLGALAVTSLIIRRRA